MAMLVVTTQIRFNVIKLFFLVTDTPGNKLWCTGPAVMVQLVEQSTYYPKVKGPNPAAAGTG
jgi:hypothetical protein